MEGSPQIEMNRLALKRILASMIAMAGIAAGRATLSRSLRLAVLKILRPAEAATRRLVVAMARPLLHEAARASAHLAGRSASTCEPGGVTSATPTSGLPAPRRKNPIILRGRGSGILLSPRDRTALRSAGPPAGVSFRMLDPLPQLHLRRRWVRQVSFPRISGFETYDRRAPIPMRPTISSSDLLDMAPLARRLEALGKALDDLPARAKRFARWRTRRLRLQAEGRSVRASPLKPGRPPGGRLSIYDPERPRRKHIREIDEILVHAHSLARYALEKPDSS